MHSRDIIDSSLSYKEALAQNPLSVCPEKILNTIGLMSVKYWGFDGNNHIGQIVVASSVIAEVEAFFELAYDINFPISKVIPTSHPDYGWDDEKLMMDNVSSGFNYRLINGTSSLSQHSFGKAFDINPIQNPYIRFHQNETIIKPERSVWEPSKPGTLSAADPLVKLMEGLGWEWGGNWAPDSGRTDYQHFQKT